MMVFEHYLLKKCYATLFLFNVKKEGPSCEKLFGMSLNPTQHVNLETSRPNFFSRMSFKLKVWILS
jgi:hypothetical protein